MVLAESVRKGGRYTKKEQEERRLRVYQLHFENNKSAVQISEFLGINRNTINEDIKFWHNQELNKSGLTDIISKMKKQIQRSEIQRDRILEYLEEVSSIDEKLRLEKAILDIDNKLVQFYSKVIFSEKDEFKSIIKTNNISEEEVKDFVKDLISRNKKTDYYEDELKFKFIEKTKSNLDYANKIIKRMHEDGLSLCKGPTDLLFHRGLSYDLQKFAKLRGYLSTKNCKISHKEGQFSKGNEKRDE